METPELMIDTLLNLFREDRHMKLRLDKNLKAGDVARDLAAIGYVIRPNGMLTRREYKRGERECQERLQEIADLKVGGTA